MSARNPRLGYALVIAAATLFGINGGVSRVAMGSDLTPLSFTTLRITGATVVFALLALAIHREAFRPPRGRALWLIGGLGLVGVVGLQLTYNIAIDRLPLGVALLVEYLGPLLVVLWVRLVRGEPVRDRMWVAIGLALLGLTLVSQAWLGLEFDGLGIVMALLAAVSFAAYFLLGEHDIDDPGAKDPISADPLRVILWAFIAATVVMNLVEPVPALSSLGGSTDFLGRLDGLAAPPWLVVAWVVIFGTVLPFFLLLIALRHLPATVVSIMAMLEPVIANVLGWAWFEESLSAIQLLGVVTVLAGIVMAQTARRETPEALPQP